MKILYGTTNQGKLLAMKKSVEGMDMEIICLRDLDCDLPVIVENGKTPLENAEIKARAYFEAFHMPVFSCDSGLYFDELAEEEQPGIHVRRVGGKELTDAEMTEQAYLSLRLFSGFEIAVAHKDGAQWQKEQMMKETKDGMITFDYYGDNDKIYGCIAHDSFSLEELGLKDGDKVKLIIIKEGKQ